MRVACCSGPAARRTETLLRTKPKSNNLRPNLKALNLFRPDEKEIDPQEHYLRDVVIHGSPERVLDQLLALEQEIPLESLLLSPLSERTFELFTDRVLPRLAG